jgi:hypothetical protein
MIATVYDFNSKEFAGSNPLLKTIIAILLITETKVVPSATVFMSGFKRFFGQF